MQGLKTVWRKLMSLSLGRLLKWGVVTGALLAIVVVLGFVGFVAWPVHLIPAEEPVDQYVYLDQGWGDSADAALRQRYYYTPQGTMMPQGNAEAAVRYNWFVHLELPLSEQRFADPAHLRRYRFLVDPAPTPANPDHLPVGFTRHFEPAIGEDVLDITCAACHNGELHYRKDNVRYALRVDGGQAMHAFTDMERGDFGPLLIAALISTASNPWKFERFAQKVLAERYPDGKSALRSALWTSVNGLLAPGQNHPWKNLYPVREGFGRTDALGRIGNTVFGDHLVAENYQPGAAPVSYPYLWNIWKFDWVQYNGSVAQPLARNIGEALGVGATIPLRAENGGPLPDEQRFRSSVRIGDLHRIETALQQLTPPRWPEAILGSIDQARAESGKQLFERHCRECHGPHVADLAEQQASAPGKTEPGLLWRIEVIPLEHIGTDPAAAQAFVDRRYDLSSTGLTNAELQDALRPLLIRQLARDVRFRLQQLVATREQHKLPVAELPALLAAWPNPDSAAIPSLPRAQFGQLETAILALQPNVPMPPASPAPTPSWSCGDDCQTTMLLWSLRYGAAQIDKQLAAIDVTQLSEGAALNLVGILIKNRYYADNGIDAATQQCLEGFGTLDLPQAIAGYKPRPLAGVWATPPFLHNGSVPTLYQLLLPPEQREQRFFVGNREFDPVQVGYQTKPATADDDGFWLDTRIAGNRNSGHAFAADAESWQRHVQDPKKHPLPSGVIGPLLSDDERYALIEYLKVHEDPATPVSFQPPQCQLLGQTL